MRSPRKFTDRNPDEQRWLTENTWCDACCEADLGISSPAEYEEKGRVFVEGNCSRCGARISSEVIVREASSD